MIIGISGKAGSGKDTLGSIIKKLNSSFVIKQYGAKLKEVASILCGVDPINFESQEFKNSEMPEEWWKFKNPTPTYGGMYDKLTYREFLQKIGTEALRNNVHSDVWVNALYADYKDKAKDYISLSTGEIIKCPGGYPNWIITDVRFPNEFKNIKDRGGIVIRVNRDYQNPLMPDISIDEHPSETALDDYTFDYVIENDSSIDKLEVEARLILHSKGLI